MDAATRLFRLAAGGRVELRAPDLVFPEAVSALRKLARLGAISESTAGDAVDYLGRLPIAATGTTALLPAMWGMRAFLTTYDACYVALADELAATFVTGERDLVRKLLERRKPALYLGDL